MLDYTHGWDFEMTEFTNFKKRMGMNPYQRHSLDRIATAADHHEYMTGKIGATFEDAVQFVLTKQKMRHILSLATEAARGDPVYARVEANRWIADCADPECAGAEGVDPRDPRFFCFHCKNERNKYKPRPVVFPSDMDEAEQILILRKDPINRNFTPMACVLAKPDLLLRGFTGETVAVLKAENIANGEPTPTILAGG